ncbi:MAG: exodeoxyribonuclease VII large subunit [Clostridia bacterium]|nr:exodeoxyribonuclease VII large subunit [Clostridia bacterium]
MENEKIFSVSNINKYIKMVFDKDPFLSYVAIKGEITNFKAHSSGHLYFTLKDESSTIKCVMFKSAAQNLKVKLQDGAAVIVMGSVSVYDVGGTYQVYVKSITLDGIGELFAKYEELKKKLEVEGLFSPMHKKKIPFMPNRVGVITSPTGAVIRDIINVSTRRFSKPNLLLFPAAVQGDMVASTVISGLRYFNKTNSVDVIIIARGGGSFEDLFGFNDESLAREIFASKIPVVSAVGHETDFTICDFVSDLRAPTPSAAAELVYPSEMEITSKLDTLNLRLKSSIVNMLDRRKQYLESVTKGRLEKTPQDMIARYRIMTDNYERHLSGAIDKVVIGCKTKYEKQVALLDSLSPLKTMLRGYSVATDSKGKLISKLSDVNIGDEISIRVTDGKVNAKVESIGG